MPPSVETRFTSELDRVTARLGRTISRRDSIRVILAALGSLFVVGLAGCQQMLGSAPGVPPVRDEPSPGDPAADDRCAPECGATQVCVDGSCLEPHQGIGGVVGALRFWVRSHGEQEAEARFFEPGEGKELHVYVTGEERAVIVWDGVSIDGFGALSPTEAQALRTLAASPLRTALWRVPLELGCHFDHLDLPIYAALVFPWQLLLKYDVTERDTHVASALAGVSCAYLPTPGQLVEGYPRPRFPYLQHSLPFPYVPTFWALDGEGAATASAAIGDVGPRSSGRAGSGGTAPSVRVSSAPAAAAYPQAHCPSASERRINEFGPGQALCRDACGADCPGTCCHDDEYTCVVDSGGRYTGHARVTRTYVCGVHPGCSFHDTCYDSCVETYGPCLNSRGEQTVLLCQDFQSFACHRLCDATTVLRYGKLDPALWSLGYGPTTHHVAFEYDLGVGRSEETEKACPPGECAPAGSARRRSTTDPPDDDECPT